MSKECCFLSFSGNQRITNQIEYLRISQNKWATDTIFLFPETKGSKKQFSKKGRREGKRMLDLSMQPAMKLEQLENTRRHKELSLHQNSVMAFFINL